MAADKQKDAFMTVGGQTGMAGAAPGRLNRLSGCLIINFPPILPPLPLSLSLSCSLASRIPDLGSMIWGQARCLLMLSGASLSQALHLKEAWMAMIKRTPLTFA